MGTEPKIDAVGAQSKPSNDTETSHNTDIDSTSTTTATVSLEKTNDATNHMDIDPVETPAAIGNEKVDNQTPEASSSIHTDVGNNNHSTDIVGATTEVLERVLYRLTGGLPKCELHLIVQESNECEVALLEEIRVLEEALATIAKDDDDTEMKVDGVPAVEGIKDNPTTISLHSILESQNLSPLDRFYTASALLGRLRDDMAVPSITSTTKDQNHTATTNTTTMTLPALENEVETALDEFMDPNSPFNGIYTRMIVDQETLLSLWKKISTNRAAFVFKRPVKSEEAPGYTDRIDFPMDLSLIRKRIITNNIQTYIDFHHSLALISHNCVKYNGRDTDYGRVARDFEAMVDHSILQAVQQHATLNQDGASKEVKVKEIMVSPDVSTVLGTPISAVPESPAPTESVKSNNDITGLDTATKEATNVTVNITLTDAKANVVGKLNDGMIISS